MGAVVEELETKNESREAAVTEQHVVPEQGAGERYPSVVEEEPEPEAKPKAKATKK
jgi:hypothetical protein